MFPFTFFNKDYPIPSWPEDHFTDFDQNAAIILVFRWNNHLIYADESGFESTEIDTFKQLTKKSNFTLENLHFDDFWHIFALKNQAEIYLIGLRDKVSHDLVFEEKCFREESELACISYKVSNK